MKKTKNNQKNKTKVSEKSAMCAWKTAPLKGRLWRRKNDAIMLMRLGERDRRWENLILCNSLQTEKWGPVAIWRSLMCPLAQVLQKSQTLPHGSTLTKPGQLCGVLTENTTTEEVLMVLFTCVREYGMGTAYWQERWKTTTRVNLNAFDDTYSSSELHLQHVIQHVCIHVDQSLIFHFISFAPVLHFVTVNLISTNLLQGLLWFCLALALLIWVWNAKLWDCSQDLLSPYLPGILHRHTYTGKATNASTIGALCTKKKKASAPYQVTTHNLAKQAEPSSFILCLDNSSQCSLHHTSDITAGWQGWKKDRWWWEEEGVRGAGTIRS